jgi:hypothetical protein
MFLDISWRYVMKLVALLGAIAATTLTAVPATAAVSINGSVAASIVGVSSSTASIDVGTTFTNTFMTIVGSSTGDFAGIGHEIFGISSLTALKGQIFSFSSSFGDFGGLVNSVVVTGDINNRTVSAYVLGEFGGSGFLSGYQEGPASVTLSFTQTGVNGATSGSFSLASPPAPIPAVPEPAIWAMMIVGFGLIGGAMRYRRRSATVTFA